MTIWLKLTRTRMINSRVIDLIPSINVNRQPKNNCISKINIPVIFLISLFSRNVCWNYHIFIFYLISFGTLDFVVIVDTETEIDENCTEGSFIRKNSHLPEKKKLSKYMVFGVIPCFAWRVFNRLFPHF